MRQRGRSPVRRRIVCLSRESLAGEVGSERRSRRPAREPLICSVSRAWCSVLHPAPPTPPPPLRLLPRPGIWGTAARRDGERHGGGGRGRVFLSLFLFFLDKGTRGGCKPDRGGQSSQARCLPGVITAIMRFSSLYHHHLTSIHHPCTYRCSQVWGGWGPHGTAALMVGSESASGSPWRLERDFWSLVEESPGPGKDKRCCLNQGDRCQYRSPSVSGSQAHPLGPTSRVMS